MPEQTYLTPSSSGAVLLMKLDTKHSLPLKKQSEVTPGVPSPE